MSDADVELGPVDYVAVAFPAGQAHFSGEMASELVALMESNTVRVFDLLLLTKDVDGSVEASECGRTRGRHRSVPRCEGRVASW